MHPEEVTLRDVIAARERLTGRVIRSPLIRLEEHGAPPIWCKLENLQPIGSFKIRGAGNALLSHPTDVLSGGVVTASAGNMAQGVAWWARRLGVPSTAIVPDTAPANKLAAIERLGGRVVKVPYARWWNIMTGDEAPGEPGVFVHPVADANVVAGNGTIGLEILEDLPDVETILVPFGGGGLSCGIATAVRDLRPAVRVIGCEVETATPLRASLVAGEPRTIERRPSFVDGIGGSGILAAMWPLVKTHIAGAAVVSLDAIVGAILRLMSDLHVVAEGAGAASVAAALDGHAEGPTVCVISGGNIDQSVLTTILSGEMP